MRDPHVPTLLGEAGRFLVERELGRGDSAVTYLARERRAARRVAVKVLVARGEQARQAFRREFELGRAVDHVNVARTLDFFEEDGEAFFSVQLAEGQDLVRYLRGTGDGAVGKPDRASWFRRVSQAFQQLARGLRALHDAGIVHQDVKPDNVLVAFSGHLKIVDHGLAATIGSATTNSGVGTATYVAPERSDGPPVTPAVDLYSAGVVLFQALTGRLPHEGSAEEILQSKRTVPAPRLTTLVSDAPPGLDDLCAVLLQREAPRRPDAQGLADRIAASLGQR